LRPPRVQRALEAQPGPNTIPKTVARDVPRATPPAEARNPGSATNAIFTRPRSAVSSGRYGSHCFQRSSDLQGHSASRPRSYSTASAEHCHSEASRLRLAGFGTPGRIAFGHMADPPLDDPHGRLELTWTNKHLRLLADEDGGYGWVSPSDYRVAEVRLLDNAATFGVTGADRNRAKDNLLIRGDALNALTSLAELPEFASEYVGKVKLAYLDPPFNTQQAFLDYDDALEHSVWLTMMRDRFRIIRRLLAPEGSIWVHLDHVESHRCRAVLDEEFGASNFVAEVAWEKAVTPRNNTGKMTVSHDTILVYRKSGRWRLNRLQRLALSDSRHKSQDGDPIPWRDNPTDAPGASTHQGMVYAIQHPITGDLMYTKVGRCWGREQSWFLEQMNEWAPYELREIRRR
jgi:hypothetical protein